MIDPQLRQLLVCPQDHGTLLDVTDTDGKNYLYNPRLHLLYRIDDDIPVLLTHEAHTATDEQHTRFTT